MEALKLYKKGRVEEGIELLKQGLKNLPSSYEIFITFISSLINAGEYDEAIKVFNENSLPKIANDPEIWNSIGVGYSKKGDFEKSIDFYEKALALDHDYPKAFNNLGLAYMAKGDNSRAYDYFNKFMMKYSNSLSFSEKKKLES